MISNALTPIPVGKESLQPRVGHAVSSSRKIGICPSEGDFGALRGLANARGSAYEPRRADVTGVLIPVGTSGKQGQRLGIG